MTGQYDPKTNSVWWGMANPAPDYDYSGAKWKTEGSRPGDNLYSCSTVAIDVKTGQIKWHYQGTPNDGWDYDGVNEFVTYEKDGKILGGKADRNGFFYVLDAKNGKLENAFPFVRKITWAKGVDLKTGRPIFDPANRPGDPLFGNRKAGVPDKSARGSPADIRSRADRFYHNDRSAG